MFLLDQKVDIEEFISRVKDIAIGFNTLSEEQKIMLRRWLKNTVIRQFILVGFIQIKAS